MVGKKNTNDLTALECWVSGSQKIGYGRVDMDDPEDVFLMFCFLIFASTWMSQEVSKPIY